MLNISPACRDYFYLKVIGNALADCRSVLDLGCGDQSPIAWIPKTFTSTGMDIYAPSIDESRRRHIHDGYITGDILRVRAHVAPKSFDAVLMLDVIEHLPKKTGLRILHDLEHIARKRIIVVTPNGFLPQDQILGNTYQKHLSGWQTDDFHRLGYAVYGVRGLKFLRKVLGRVRYKPWILWAPIVAVTEPILFRFPELSYQLLAIKTV